MHGARQGLSPAGAGADMHIGIIIITASGFCCVREKNQQKGKKTQKSGRRSLGLTCARDFGAAVGGVEGGLHSAGWGNFTRSGPCVGADVNRTGSPGDGSNGFEKNLLRRLFFEGGSSVPRRDAGGAFCRSKGESGALRRGDLGPCFETPASRAPQHEVSLFEDSQDPHPEERRRRVSKDAISVRQNPNMWSRQKLVSPLTRP